MIQFVSLLGHQDMDISIEFKSGIPLYEQIAQQVLELIQSGELRPGNQLPTTRQLAVDLGVNFNTVARAYRMLDQDSVISTQHGRGTYILEQNSPKQDKKGNSATIEDLTRFYLRKATYLGFEPKEIQDCINKIVKEEKGD
jgi:GntR family transcriptional regulator